MGTNNSSNNYGVTKFIVDPVGGNGSHTTITAANTAAVSGDVIYIRPGTYVEDITMKAGVSYIAFSGMKGEANTIVQGLWTYTATGKTTIQGLLLTSNGSGIITISGTNSLTLELLTCQLNYSNTGLFCSNANAGIGVDSCSFDSVGGTDQAFNITGGNFDVIKSDFQNHGGSSTSASFSSGGTFVIDKCRVLNKITTSGTGNLQARYTSFIAGQITPFNMTAVTHNATGGSSYADFCIFDGGTAAALTIGAGASLPTTNCIIRSSGASAISGLGTLSFSALAFPSTSDTISTSTQVARATSNDTQTVVTPGAYPYTTKPQDDLILVDTTSARTIIPAASPSVGLQYTIKDSVGSASTNNITVTPSGQNIDGAASFVMNSSYRSITIIFNGTEWSIV